MAVERDHLLDPARAVRVADRRGQQTGLELDPLLGGVGASSPATAAAIVTQRLLKALSSPAARPPDRARKTIEDRNPQAGGQVVRLSLGSSRGSSWISFSARGTPAASSRLRSRSAFSSIPNSSARLLIQNQTSSETRPPSVP